MKTALARLIGSMKFQTLLLGLVLTPSAALLAKHGFNVSDDTVKLLAELMTIGFSILLGAQGLTDHGKEAAKAKGTTVEGVGGDVNLTVVKPPSEGGYVRLDLLAVLLTCGAVLLFGCGASQREKTIRATFHATNVAADSLVVFSKTHEDAIIDAATSKETAQENLKQFRAKVDHAEMTITAVYRMTAAAAIANDDQSVAALIKVAALLWTELKELGVKVPI